MTTKLTHFLLIDPENVCRVIPLSDAIKQVDKDQLDEVAQWGNFRIDLF